MSHEALHQGTLSVCLVPLGDAVSRKKKLMKAPLDVRYVRTERSMSSEVVRGLQG